MIGAVLLGRYEILERLGEGGMGSVYRGRHATLHRPLALKVLKRELVKDQSLVERFLREARATASIGHENIIDITDVDQLPDGTAFFAMELLEGHDLDFLLRQRRRLPWPRAREILIQVARALAAAHAVGIIHRDMKPANVYLVPRRRTLDFVKILDFGIAKVEAEVALTQAGMVFGTAGYMAPEQAMGKAVDARTDVYALSCMMYEMLTGRLPFPGDNYLKVLAAHVKELPPHPREVAPEALISPAVENIILRGLAKLPEHRFQDMQAFEHALMSVDDDGSFQQAPVTAGYAAHHDLGHSEPVRQTDSYAPGYGAALESGPPMHPGGSGRSTTVTVSALDGNLDPSLLAALAFVFVAFAHGTDGLLTNAEMRTLAVRMREWAPGLSLEATGDLLRQTVADYGALPSALKTEQAAQCTEQLGYALPEAQRTKVLADLQAIAGADGVTSPAESQFIERVAQRFGVARDPRLRACAFLYLAMGQATDGFIEAQEMKVIGEQLRQWVPGASMTQTGEVLRETVAAFKQLQDREARLDHARRCADLLVANTDQQTLRVVLADLWRIAGADGQISPEEQHFIMEMVDRFGTAR